MVFLQLMGVPQRQRRTLIGRDRMYTVHKSQRAAGHLVPRKCGLRGELVNRGSTRGRSLKRGQFMATSSTADIEFASHYLDVDGIRTHYLEAGSGPTLVLIHGGGAGADAWGNWRGCIPLYARHFRVVAVDMVGFGKTDKPDPAHFGYTQEDRNAHMIGFIGKLNVGAVNIIGNS